MTQNAEINEIEEVSGYEHGLLDSTQVGVRPMHLSEFNPRAWDEATADYRSGYDAGWVDGQPNVTVGG